MLLGCDIYQKSYFSDGGHIELSLKMTLKVTLSYDLDLEMAKYCQK